MEVGKIKLMEAADKIGRSYRQAKRIWKRVKEEEIKGVIHGNTGRLSNHRTAKDTEGKVLQLSQQPNGKFNDAHFFREARGAGMIGGKLFILIPGRTQAINWFSNKYSPQKRYFLCFKSPFGGFRGL